MSVSPKIQLQQLVDLQKIDDQISEHKKTLADIARQYQADSMKQIGDPDLRDRLLRHEMDSRSYQLTQQRVIAETRASAPALATSILKVTGARLTKEKAELHQQAMGLQGLGWEGDAFPQMN